MRVIFIGTSNLPIPAIRGGAIETLVTAFIDSNERVGNPVQIDVYSSPYPSKAIIPNYKYTNIHIIRVSFIKKISFAVYRIIRKFVAKKLPYKNAFMATVNAMIKNTNCDALIMENTALDVSQLQRPIQAKKVFYHIHADYLKKELYGMDDIDRNVDCFLAVSNFIKEAIEKNCSVSGRRVVLVENAINLEFHKEAIIEKEALRQKLGIPEEAKVITYCGRLSEEKGVMPLIRAFKKANIDGYYLLIIGGDMFDSNRMTKYVNELYNEAKGYENKILFTGYIPHDEIDSYINASDIGAVPSICNEAASLVALEFRKYGLPVIASNIGGLPEYCSNTRTVFVNTGIGFEDNLCTAIKYIAEADINNNNEPMDAREMTYYGYDEYYVRLKKALT